MIQEKWQMNIYEELQERGLLAQVTHEAEVRDLLNNKSTSFYIGFDPTADSLHVGHYLQLITMARLQRAGHRPIALIGAGTAMVGDPSGRTDMRTMMTKETIAENANRFKIQMEHFIDFSDGKALMVNNADWLLSLNYVEFLRNVGVHYSVNRMLTAECFKSRLEKGLTFIEFNYMLMQGYDFLMLHEKYGCNLQAGGDDQWSNILGGVELIRRTHGEDAYGITMTLLTTSEGKKMGKTQKGAVWIDPEKTPPYDFYQYWRNVDDADVIKCLKMLTFISVEEINREYGHLEGKDLNRAKEALAFEITKQVHGEEEAKKAADTARTLFVSAGISDNMPTASVSKEDFIDGEISILDLLLKASLIPSKGEGRRLIEQGGLIVDDDKIESPVNTVKLAQFDKGYLIVKKGKKSITKVLVQ
jgi:tyrosyl-tRNA synthetase